MSRPRHCALPARPRSGRISDQLGVYGSSLDPPRGSSDGLHRHEGVEEIYYVMSGEGQVTLNGETAPLHKWDAVPIKFNEAHAFTNNGSADLELMVIGISAQKNVLDTELGARGGRRDGQSPATAGPSGN